MIGQRYQQKKAAVLDVVSRYQSIRGETNDGVDAEFLGQRATALRTGRYVLAVVGEGKAGKSTLINALLGERVLPTDALQSSSLVVEIFKSSRKVVEVRYADGHTDCRHDDGSTPEIDEAVEYLRSIAALQEQYRTIPTVLIDTFIVQGRIKSGFPIPLDELRHESGLPLDGTDEQRLIKKYVTGRSLGQIPVEIAFGFPLKYAFDELRLVDSPGVNAVGGVQDRTFTYLNKANAVLFVHSLSDAVERASFRDFVTNVAPNRTRKTLFLVLSKSGGLSRIEVDAKVSEARSLFGQWLDPRHVIPVDSILQTVSNEIQDFESPAALRGHYAERKRHYDARCEAEPSRVREWREEAISFHQKLDLLNDTLEEVVATAGKLIVAEELRRRSNFGTLEKAIEELSSEAPDQQLSEILEVIRRGYENQNSEHDQTIELLGRQKRNPQEFENEISQIQDLLEEYELSMNKFGQATMRKYTGVKPTFRSQLDQLATEYTERVKASTSRNGVRKTLVDFDDELRCSVDAIAAKIRQDYVEEEQRMGQKFKADHSIELPKVEVAAIEERAKQRAYDTRTVDRSPEGFWETCAKIVSLGLWNPTESKRVLNPDRMLSEFKKLAEVEINEKVLEGRTKFITNVADCLNEEFCKDVRSLISGREHALEGLRRGRSENDEILARIEETKRKGERVVTERSRVDEMLEDLR